MSVDSGAVEGSFAAKLRQSAINFDARSPFVATSGHGDSYKSITELSSSSRAGLILTKHAVPSLPLDSSKEHELE